MSTLEKVKLYGMSIQMVERDLDAVEAGHKLELHRATTKSKDRDDDFYPQFDEAVRREASSMAQHYEIASTPIGVYTYDQLLEILETRVASMLSIRSPGKPVKV